MKDQDLFKQNKLDKALIAVALIVGYMFLLAGIFIYSSLEDVKEKEIDTQEEIKEACKS